MCISIFWNVALLFVFKYLSFVVKNLNLLPFVNLPAVNIALPIGISFFSFQIMSYVFDVYYHKTEVQKNWFDLALYISLFPQLIAGPIVRYSTIQAEIRGRIETSEDFTSGIKRFVIGLAKKSLLANYVAVIADLCFSQDLLTLTCADAWIGAIAYSLQIYFDFSGYSDMAIGLGRMFGFHFEENFNYPYMASSVTDFWRRWHISLSTWFRDYVYIPLGGNRCSKPRWIFNLSCVWLFTGIWHGANWTFILWGIYYLCLLLLEKLTPFGKKRGFLMHIYALLAIVIGWVLFRSENILNALLYLKAMFLPFTTAGLGDLFTNFYLQNGGVLLAIACVFAFPILPFVNNKLLLLKGRASQCVAVAKSILLVALFALALLACIKSSYNPFIYFNF